MENKVVIEKIYDIASTRPLGDSRVKNAKKISENVKMCRFIKDMPCKLPLCDLKVCEKCPEGFAYCTRVNFIKKMIEKVLLFIISLIIVSEL
jgi:hypothetical protein